MGSVKRCLFCGTRSRLKMRRRILGLIFLAEEGKCGDIFYVGRRPVKKSFFFVLEHFECGSPTLDVSNENAFFG